MILAPDLNTVEPLADALNAGHSTEGLSEIAEEARRFLSFYDWCDEIREEYVGLFVDGIVGVLLFRIAPSRVDVDEWIWVIAGDLPPAYLTCEECPSAEAALDGYIGAMSEWVDAARNGKSVAELIPVNVTATPANAEMLDQRLTFLDQRILRSSMTD